MRKVLNVFTKIAIVISIYSYLLVAAVETFGLDIEQNGYAYLSLKVGLLGIGYYVQKLLVKLVLPEVKLFFTEEDERSDPEEMAKIARITFTIGSFLLSLMAVSGILMMVKGYNVLNEIGAVGYLGLIFTAIIITKVYKKWGYPQEFAAIDKH